MLLSWTTTTREEEESWGSGDDGTGYGRAQHQQAGRGCTFLTSGGCTYGSPYQAVRVRAQARCFSGKFRGEVPEVTRDGYGSPSTSSSSAIKTLFQSRRRLQHCPRQPDGQAFQGHFMGWPLRQASCTPSTSIALLWQKPGLRRLWAARGFVWV